MNNRLTDALHRITDELNTALADLEFAEPVTHVYNPLVYARGAYRQYLERYASAGVEYVLVGMNPGPWGMAQTGIPFGEVSVVRDWLKIDGEITRPDNEHPKRPIQGLECERSEVSGRRIWGWVQSQFKTPERFFERFFLTNYCPLVFMEESGRNRTPPQLPVAERRPLLKICDQALRQTILELKPTLAIGIGKFAEARLKVALKGVDIEVGRILHPSPASPLANKGWEPRAVADLETLGVHLEG